MYSYPYPRPSLTADVVLLDAVQRTVLLVCRGREPYKGCWAFPGGFFDMDDVDIEQTARRELQEETGLSLASLQLATVASRVGRDPRGRTISVVFYALVDQMSFQPQAGDDAAQATWHKIDNLPPLAFDHKEILQTILHQTNLYDTTQIR